MWKHLSRRQGIVRTANFVMLAGTVLFLLTLLGQAAGIK